MAKKAPSQFVCSVCGLAVHSWMSGWKHSAGPNQKSCGKPRPMKREDYEKNLQDAINAVKERK